MIQFWHDQPVDNHFKAFVYFCIRQGDEVVVAYRSDDRADLYIKRP